MIFTSPERRDEILNMSYAELKAADVTIEEYREYIRVHHLRYDKARALMNRNGLIMRVQA